MKNAVLSLRHLLAYGFMAFPLAFVGLPLYLYVPDFYATYHGLDLGILGLILLGVRLFDAVQDPLIGKLSDRFSHKRPEIMLVTFVIFVCSFFLIYHPYGHKVIWLVAMLVLSTTAYSVLSINLNAIGSLWSHNPVQKTRIVSVRESFGVVGLLLAVLILPMLDKIIPDHDNYGLYSFVILLLSIAAGVLFFLWLFLFRRKFVQLYKYKSSLKPVFHRQSVLFFFVYGLSALSAAIPAVLLVFFVRDYLRVEAYIGIFLLLYFVAAFSAMPLWQKIAAYKGKQQTWLYAMVLAVISFAGTYLLQAGDIIPYAVICILSGVAFGAELILPASILSDMIEKKSHRPHTSAYFSMISFLAKFSLALASGGSFLLLDRSSFVPAASNGANAIHILLVSYALIPCVIKAVSACGLAYLIHDHKKDDFNETYTHSGSDRISSHV